MPLLVLYILMSIQTWLFPVLSLVFLSLFFLPASLAAARSAKVQTLLQLLLCFGCCCYFGSCCCFCLSCCCFSCCCRCTSCLLYLFFFFLLSYTTLTSDCRAAASAAAAAARHAGCVCSFFFPRNADVSSFDFFFRIWAEPANIKHLQWCLRGDGCVHGARVTRA